MLTKENTKCEFCKTDYMDKSKREDKTFVLSRDKKEDKAGDKTIEGSKIRQFRKFRDKMEGETKGNFRQRAEAVGVSPEDIRDFKYWLRDNR